MNVMLTGATGYIGNNILKKLSVNNNIFVHAVCRRENLLDSYSKLNNVKVYTGDLSNIIPVEDKVDVIIHTAARTPELNVSFCEYVKSNIIATNNLLKYALINNVNLFIYLSAISVYGNIEKSMVNEDTPVKPKDYYSITKYIAESLLDSENRKLNSFIFRLPIVIGREMKNGWFYDTYRRIEEGLNVKIYNKDSLYNVISIGDLCQLIENCIYRNISGCNVFTLTAKNLLTIGDICKKIKKSTKSNSIIEEVKSCKSSFCISYDKAESMLDYKPSDATDVIECYLNK